MILHGVEEGKQPLIIINDKEVSDKEALSKIAPDRIKSFSILKDKTATSIYGEKGKNGVIIVTLLTKESINLKKIIRKNLMLMLWNWQKVSQKG